VVTVDYQGNPRLCGNDPVQAKLVALTPAAGNVEIPVRVSFPGLQLVPSESNQNLLGCIDYGREHEEISCYSWTDLNSLFQD
jgi:hypothetical protein